MWLVGYVYLLRWPTIDMKKNRFLTAEHGCQMCCGTLRALRLTKSHEQVWFVLVLTMKGPLFVILPVWV